MIELFTEAMHSYKIFAQQNQAIALALSAWFLATGSLLLRNIPMRLYTWCKRQATTTLEIHNEDTGTNQQSFDGFCNWLFAQKSIRFSRTLLLNGGWRRAPSENGHDYNYETYSYIGPGDGLHYFWIGRRLFWAQMSSVKEGTINQIKRTIMVSTFGRNHDIMRALVDKFIYKPRPKSIALYTCTDGSWNMSGDLDERPLTSVAVNGTVVDDVLTRVRAFDTQRDWYRSKGISYKLSFLFHGPTGTGKTSLVRALATELKRSIYQLNLNRFSDESLSKALAGVKRGSIVLVEDFDSATALRARPGIEKDGGKKKRKGDSSKNVTAVSNFSGNGDRVAAPVADAPAAAAPPPMADLWTPLTLSGILNAFDGVVGLDGCLIIFTTNVVHQIDEAMRRPGRIDETYLIDHLDHASVCKYVAQMAPEVEYSPYPEFERISGAELQSHLLRHLHDPYAFVASIPRVSPVIHLEPAPVLENVAA